MPVEIQTALPDAIADSFPSRYNSYHVANQLNERDHKRMQVLFHDLAEIPEEQIAYAVLLTRHDDRWIYVRHKQRDTWEIPGGRREAGETVIQTASRELFEETGALTFTLEPLRTYSVVRDGKPSYGRIFLADVSELGPLPDSEIGTVEHFDDEPSRLTYPDIQPLLLREGLALMKSRMGKTNPAVITPIKAFSLSFGLPPEAAVGTRIIRRTAVRAVIERNGLLLMVRNNRGDVKFPGGGLEEGESHEETLRREVLEETGHVMIRVGRKLGTATERHPDIRDPEAFFEMISHYYECGIDSDSGIQNLDDYEAEMGFEPVWIPVSAAIENNRVLLAAQAASMNRWVGRETAVLEYLARH